MKEVKEAMKFLEKFPDLMAFLDPILRKIPMVEKIIEDETKSVLSEIGPSLKPYKDKFENHAMLPAKGIERKAILDDLKKMHDLESDRWQEGYVSGGIYHGDKEHIDFLNQVYALHSQTNPLHSDLFPGILKCETEVISMTSNMLSGNRAAEMDICGSVTSGGTESILLAMKTYRDRARVEKGITAPEMVLPITAHTAFDKAAEYFNIKIRRLPLDKNFRADVNELRKNINRNTIVVVGSAPNFPHGVIDPIEAMSEIARLKGVGFHTDCCLGGFVLPFAEKLGYSIPPFDFRLPGVTSMSADTHKFGYAAKGTSIVMYRGAKLRKHQFFAVSDWPGGLYFSPTLSGSRPGGLSAAAWAAMLSIGEDGYLKNVSSIMKTAEALREGIKKIPGLKLIGDPTWIIAFASDEFDIYRVYDRMAEKHWNLNGLHRPACVHICVTLRHTQAGVTDRFLTDLGEAVEHVRSSPAESGGWAPIYGMAGSIPVRSTVRDLLRSYLDLLFRV